jgi:hypothetical protein
VLGEEVRREGGEEEREKGRRVPQEGCILCLVICSAFLLISDKET